MARLHHMAVEMGIQPAESREQCGPLPGGSASPGHASHRCTVTAQGNNLNTQELSRTTVPNFLLCLPPLKTGGECGLIPWVKGIALCAFVSGTVRLLTVPTFGAQVTRLESTYGQFKNSFCLVSRCLFSATILALLDLSIGVLLWAGLRLYAYRVLYKALETLMWKGIAVVVGYAVIVVYNNPEHCSELLWIWGKFDGSWRAVLFCVAPPLALQMLMYAAVYYAVWSYTVAHDPRWTADGGPCICEDRSARPSDEV